MKKRILLMMCVLILGCSGCGDEASGELIPLDELQSGQEVIEVKVPDDAVQPEQTDQVASAEMVLPEEICVHICGAVSEPGVYTVEDGARVCELIGQAGGMTEEAAADYLNQAAFVADGQRIYVPTQTEIEEGFVIPEGTNPGGSQGGESNTEAVININQASVEQLMELPGIGDSRAQSIIAYREANGGFKTKEEIMQVDGIKEGMYAKMKDKFSVD